VRNFIAAPEGSILVSLDFSQIELRVGAFYCRDERMLETYHTGTRLLGGIAMKQTNTLPPA
jgi:DNA polymerase-1